MKLLERLLASTHAVAARDRELVRIEPFTAYVDLVRPLKYVSFALPDVGAGSDAAPALPALREAFTARDRTPRTEFFEDLSPDLGTVLEEAGWSLSERMAWLTAPDDAAERIYARAGFGVRGTQPA